MRRRRLRSKPIPHVIIPDTSILWCQDKKTVVNPEFDKFWVDHHKLVPLLLVIPEIVRGELLFQQVTSAKKHLEKLTSELGELSAITELKYEFHATADEIRGHLYQKFNHWLEQKKGIIRALPQQADWAKIAEAAVWRQPPFSYDPKNPDNEKGFRDALILEILCDYVARETQNVGMAFVCSDKLLLETAKNRIADDFRCSCYGSLAELSSYVKLTHERHEKEFTTNILKVASKRFFTPNDENCLWSREKIRARLEGEYEQSLKLSADEAKEWEPLNTGTWFISNAQFSKSSDNGTYHWQSPLNFVRVYGYKKPDWMTSEKDLSGQNVSLLEALGSVLAKIAVRQRKVLQVNFSVFWSMAFDQNGRMTHLQMEKILPEGRSFAPINEQIRKQFNLTNL